MASVTKDARGRSPYWTMCYTAPDGRQLKKSSKTRDRDKAMRMALQLERAGRLGASGELTEHRARELLAELMEQISDGKETLRSTTTEQWFKGWLETKRAKLATGSMWSYQRAVGAFLDHIGPLSKKPLSFIQTEHVQGFINSLTKAKLSPTSVRIYTKLLRSSLDSAMAQELITRNPAAKAAVELPEGLKAERGVFNLGELKLILEEARKTSPDWFTVTLVGVYTGQRLRDCTDLEWAGVNFVDGTVTFKVYKKRGKKHSMPMHPILRRHLESMAGDTAEKYVAPSLAGRETGGRSGLSMEFSEIMQRAGVEAGQAERTGKRAMSSRSFHSLRHTLTSLMANGDVAPELRQRITGHDSERIHQQYTHHEQRSLARALSVIPDLTAD